MAKYWGSIKTFGSIALGLFVFAALFANVAPTLVDETTRKGVLFNAVPFFAAFVGVLLLYILLIVLAAKRFNGRVPLRTYKGIENTAIIGIVFGVVCLFQSFSFVPYRYGFLVLLGATLTFILWSHVKPSSSEFEARVRPLTHAQHLAGLAAGLVLIVLMVSAIAARNAPVEPYGVRQRAWDTYKPEKKAEIAATALSSFNSVELPFLVIWSMFPAAIVYLIVRESLSGRPRLEAEALGSSSAD